MIHQHPSPPQLFANAPVSIPPLVFDEDVLNRRPDFHIFLDGLPLLQRPVESGPAHARQLTHSLDAQFALHRHQLPDLVVDAASPGCLLLWRRASTFCKAPLKKSASSALSATSRFSCATCNGGSRSWVFSGTPWPWPIGSS